MFRLATVQDFSAVTAACLLVRTAVYDSVHGLDEEFTVAYNDVDFCLRVRDAGWRIVWTPYAELYHHESKSAARTRTTRQKRRALTPSMTVCTRCMARRTSSMTPTTARPSRWITRTSARNGDLRHLK